MGRLTVILGIQDREGVVEGPDSSRVKRWMRNKWFSARQGLRRSVCGTGYRWLAADGAVVEREEGHRRTTTYRTQRL